MTTSAQAAMAGTRTIIPSGTLFLFDEPTTAVLSAIHENLPALEIRPLHLRRAAWDGILRSHGGVEGWSGSAPREESALPGKSSPKLDVLLRRMVAEGASDLHLAARHRPHWRIDGDIMPMLDVPELGAREVYELVEPILDDRNRREFEEQKDADFAYAIPGLARFRVNPIWLLMGGAAARCEAGILSKTAAAPRKPTPITTARSRVLSCALFMSD